MAAWRQRLRVWLTGMTVLALALGLPAASGAQAPRFARDVEDLPLLIGLAETPDSFVFDSPHGRVARILAEGGATPADVGAAYGATLPSLGWAMAQDAPESLTRAQAADVVILVFDRAGERLTLVSQALSAGRTRTVFDVRPAWTFNAEASGSTQQDEPSQGGKSLRGL